MKIKDFKNGMNLTVRDNNFGWFKGMELVPRSKGPQMVKVLHSSTEDNFDFALIKQFRISDLKEKTDER
jgi:hypothetical protein